MASATPPFWPIKRVSGFQLDHEAAANSFSNPAPFGTQSLSLCLILLRPSKLTLRLFGWLRPPPLSQPLPSQTSTTTASNPSHLPCSAPLCRSKARTAVIAAHPAWHQAMPIQTGPRRTAPAPERANDRTAATATAEPSARPMASALVSTPTSTATTCPAAAVCPSQLHSPPCPSFPWPSQSSTTSSSRPRMRSPSACPSTTLTWPRCWLQLRTHRPARRKRSAAARTALAVVSRPPPPRSLSLTPASTPTTFMSLGRR